MVQPETSVDLYILIFGGGLAMLLLVAGVVGFVFIYQKRLSDGEMRVKEMEIHYQQDVIYRTLDAVEDERKRVARDLHDEVGAALSVMRLLVGQLAQQSQTQEPVDGLVSRFKDVIDHTIDNVRRISNDLLPQGLDELGLAYALEGLCENAMDLADVDIQLVVDANLKLPIRSSLIIYRLAQELLNNALKHAEATVISLYLNNSGDQWQFRYADNGKGFTFEEAYKKRSLGLKNIETRAQMLLGTVSFETSPGHGLQVTVKWPVDSAAKAPAWRLPTQTD